MTAVAADDASAFAAFDVCCSYCSLLLLGSLTFTCHLQQESLHRVYTPTWTPTPDCLVV